MREKILTYIERNSRVDLKDLAIMLGTDEATIANEIAQMEKEGVICGYHTLIDWDKTSSALVWRKSSSVPSNMMSVIRYPKMSFVRLILLK